MLSSSSSVMSSSALRRHAKLGSRQLLLQCRRRTKSKRQCQQLNSSTLMSSSSNSPSTATMMNRPGLMRRTTTILSACKKRPSSSAVSRQQQTKELKRSTSSSSSSKKQAFSSSTETSAEAAVEIVEPPTREQLRHVFIHASIPMIGFGLMDQTVMIQAGNAIDCTIGVIFSLSTLTAAAIGQICSDASGVLFGGTVERLLKYSGLLSTSAALQLSSKQLALPIVSRATLAGNLFGIILGCSLGLLNLLFIDTSRSSTLKLQASYDDDIIRNITGNSDNGDDIHDDDHSNFTLEISNAVRPDITSLTVEGPNIDGVIANMTLALALQNSSIVEISGKGGIEITSMEDKDDESNGKMMKAVFHVVNRTTDGPFDDDELEDLATKVLESTRSPMKDINAIRYTKNLQQLRSRSDVIGNVDHDDENSSSFHKTDDVVVDGNKNKSSTLHRRQTMLDIDTIRNRRKHKQQQQKDTSESTATQSTSFGETYNKLQRRMTIVKAAHGVGDNGDQNDNNTSSTVSKKELLRRRITIIPNKRNDSNSASG